ncbi:MAG: helix-turn-helix transcriptional regulator, partial [Erythrobacter sp.]|nr:helix-turn-helix transcriptional regulator [Erythrobacter sp.]
MATQARRERRGRPTQAEAAEKRQGIVDAATALFLSSGYREVSVRRIADAADVSTRTVFNLFEDKASLFIACLDSISPGVDSPLLT